MQKTTYSREVMANNEWARQRFGGPSLTELNSGDQALRRHANLLFAIVISATVAACLALLVPHVADAVRVAADVVPNLAP